MSFLEKELDYRLYHSDCFDGLSVIAGATGCPVTAARLSAASFALRKSQGLPNLHQIERFLERHRSAWDSVVGSAAFAKAWAEGLKLDQDAAVAEARSVPRPPAFEDKLGLSTRERDVLRLLVQGSSDSEIADRLYISRHTASNHVHAILTKLGVANRAAAAALAVRHGLG